MVDLACTQAALGHEVHVCSGGGDFEALLLSHGVRHIAINQDRKPGTLARSLIAMTLSFRRLKPDIVHAHMMTSALLVAMVRPLLRFKFVTTVHNEFEKSAILMKLGQRVIAVSDAVRIAMIARGIPPGKIRTVLNGTIGSPRFPKQIVPEPLAYHPAITFVGGLHPRKGVRDLITAHAEAAKEHAMAHLYIVGSGPMEQEYIELAEQLASGRVTFLGHKDDPRTVLASSAISILPSHAEPAGLVLSEAREAGCAIIGSDIGGIPEMIAGGKAGILVPPRRPDLLAAAIKRLLHEPAYLAEMRARSQYNIANLSLARVTEETIGVYLEIL
jgi:glycosyltransferase involved in cell wall biosynthesis